MTNPYAALNTNAPAEMAAHVQQSFERGARQAREREIRRTAAQAMGGDQAALEKLYGLDPGMGATIEEQIHQRGERRRAADYRSAVGDIMLGGGAPPMNALAGQAMPSWGAQPPNSNALMRFAPPMATPGIGDGVPGNAPAASVGPRSDAMTRAIRANPEGFLKVQGQMTELTQDRLKLAVDLNDFAMQLAGGVHDQATYDMAKARAAEVYRQHGLEMPELPAEYSPEVIRGLQMQGMDTAKQLAAIVRENRLDWDIQDDIADNESLDRYRAGTLSNQRRGQDTRSRDTRRGQDITDKRVRGSAAYQGRGGKGAGAKAVLNGQTIVVRGGKWVYEASGKPVQ